MENECAVLNDFMVNCFYSILASEELALESITNGKLTLKEIHVIEAVFKAQKVGENNFSTIANMLHITLGTLTSAFSKLESKGYLIKERDKNDKRIFYLVPTRLAEMIEAEHTKWHQKLIGYVLEAVPAKDMDSFIDAIKNLTAFIKSKD